VPTLLCIDADRSYCEILARAFRAEGYEVHTAHDGEAGLESWRALRPDLVTLEVLLPRLDGFAVLEALRREEAGCAPTHVLLLTGCSPTPSYRARSEQLGALGIATKPVPLAKLLALVAKQVGAASAPARSTAARRVSLEGSLSEVPFPALLHHLHGLRASGVLHLECGRKKKKLLLEEGRPVAVKSNLVGETLGKLLAASGKISLDVMHESVQRVQRGEGLQGQILVAMHMLDEEDLAAALRNQAEEKLLEIFAWIGGSFRFERGARLAGGNTLTLKGSPANLIARGVLTRVPPEQIDAFFALHGDDRAVPASQPFYRFQQVDLDAEAQALLDRLDGTKTLHDLLPLDERARRILYVLAAIELVELERAAQPRGRRAGPLPPARAAQRRPSEGPAPPSAAPRASPPPPPRSAPPPQAARASRAAPEPARAPRPIEPRAQAPLDRPQLERDSKAPWEGPPPLEQPEPEAPLTREDAELRAELVAMAEKLRGRDHFAVLGVARTATDEPIREAYFRLAKRTHPDRFRAAHEAVRRVAEQVFGRISVAYETIGQRERRNEYLRAELTRERDKADVEEGERALRAEVEFQKGAAALRRKDYAEAVERFREAVARYGDEGEYHAYLGWALWLADPQAPRRADEARGHLLRGRKLAPGSDKPYLFLGRLYKALNKDAQAEKMFQKAIALDPECLDAIRELRLIDMRRARSRGLVRRILRR
jgi:CheY-like chemotaxis protein/curved DNA-binding protein CbpA